MTLYRYKLAFSQNGTLLPANKEAGLPSHPNSLISIFIVRHMESVIYEKHFYVHRTVDLLKTVTVNIYTLYRYICFYLYLQLKTI